jgi:hypothetical protein
MKNHTDRKNIDLPASITEAGNRRTVDTSDNLLEWLFLYRTHSAYCRGNRGDRPRRP